MCFQIMHLCVLFQSVKTKMSRLLLKTKITFVSKLFHILLKTVSNLPLANLGDDGGVVFPHHQHQVVQTGEHLDLVSIPRIIRIDFQILTLLNKSTSASIYFCVCLIFLNWLDCHLFVCFVFCLALVVQIGQVVRSWLQISLIRHKTKSSIFFYQKVSLVEGVMPVLCWGNKVLFGQIKYFQRD